MRIFSTVAALCLAAWPAWAAYEDYLARAEAFAARVAAITPATVADAISEQQALLAMGRGHALDFATQYPEFAELMGFVAGSADGMTRMTLSEIELAWHEGGALVAAGFMNTTEDHFGVLNSVIDMVVHPATAIIALRAFAETGDPALLEQVQEEMEEVIEHIAML